jgi:CBS domain-containing protein
MTRDVETCGVGDTDREVLSLMTERRFRHLPVVEDGVLSGIVSIGDVVKSRLDGIVNEADAMRDYISRG